jgi:hypothetical protein
LGREVHFSTPSFAHSPSTKLNVPFRPVYTLHEASTALIMYLQEEFVNESDDARV